MTPKVSVIIGAYNEEQYIGHAIASILGQAYQDFELIVVDDGSSDRTLQVVRSFVDPRIEVLELQHCGLAAALNAALKKARGDYIARLDADDVALVDRLELQATFLDTHPDYGIVGGQCVVVSEDGKSPTFVKTPCGATAVQRRLCRENPFVHSCVMVRRALLLEIGLYSCDVRWEDYDLWWRILSRSKGTNLPLVLCRRTLRGNRLSAVERSRSYRGRLAVQCRALARERVTPLAVIGILESSVAWLMFATLQRGGALLRWVRGR